MFLFAYIALLITTLCALAQNALGPLGIIFIIGAIAVDSLFVPIRSGDSFWGGGRV